MRNNLRKLLANLLKVVYQYSKIQFPVLGLNKGYKGSEGIDWLDIVPHSGYSFKTCTQFWCWVGFSHSESSKCYVCMFAGFSVMFVTFYIKENWLVTVLEGAQSVLVDESVAWESTQRATCPTRTTLPTEVTAVARRSIVILPWKWVS